MRVQPVAWGAGLRYNSWAFNADELWCDAVDVSREISPEVFVYFFGRDPPLPGCAVDNREAAALVDPIARADLGLLEIRAGVLALVRTLISIAVIQAPGKRDVCKRTFVIFDNHCQTILPHSPHEIRETLLCFFNAED